MSEFTDVPVAQARQIVLGIVKDKGWIEPRLRASSDPDNQELVDIIERIREELGDAVETIAQDIYSKKARFILELIQNAEDNDFTRTNIAPSIAFDVHPDKVIVECNEDGFTEAHVRSICRTGRSSKSSQRGYIGEKGIGFKSVFQVASKVHIQSNSFSFSFHYSGGTSSAEKLGIITPIPEDGVIPLGDQPLTRMTLTPIIPFDELVAQFLDISDKLLLFLSTIKELKIKIHHSDQNTTVTTFHKSEGSGDGFITLAKTVEDSGGESVTPARYFTTRKSVTNLAADRARVGIDECEVVLAFPLDQASTQDVFAFLPVRNVGFSFLIQADFLLQANRQDLRIDSARNKDILKGVAKAFRDAVIYFCSSESFLRYEWMRFLPSGLALDALWETLPDDIIQLLDREAILFSQESLEPSLPENLRTLPTSFLDKEDLPLFRDRPGVNRRYLSLQYKSRDVETLKRAFHLKDITNMEIFYRIKQDVGARGSKIKNFNTDDDWHTRSSDLIRSILLRPSDARNQIRGLDLIPLINGQWVNSLANELYFPAPSGPDIPPDLVVTIDPRATRNVSRKNMLSQLGAIPCLPNEVLERLWKCYCYGEGASDLLSSKAHLGYLYWHCGDISAPRFKRLWLYDSNERKVTSPQKVIYFASEDEYGPQELLRAVQDPRDPRRSVPSCSVPFMNSAYMDLFPSTTRRHELSWLGWLETPLGVRRIPRLRSDGGSLSPEFQHITRYRPEKVIGLLKKHWEFYKNLMSPAIVDSLSQAEVATTGSLPVVLKSTYLPLASLVEKGQALGIIRNFPFLQMPHLVVEECLLRDWRFLHEFGVGFKPNLEFYVEILRQHEARNHQSWDNEIRDKILETYQLIANNCSERKKVWLWEQLDQNKLILDPCTFQPAAFRPSWTDIESCVWNGPVGLLDKKPLASVPQYRDNSVLSHFFREILGVKDANWNDYLEMPLKLQGGSVPAADIPSKILRLYKLFSEATISNEDWTEISNSFETEGLIYEPHSQEWFSPSECLWNSPVPIYGKAIISNAYSDELKDFFLGRLRISPASLSTLVEELRSLAQRQPSVSKVKQMIWAINAMDPKEGDLDTLLNCEILPVTKAQLEPQSSICLQSCQADFVIIDRKNLADIFDGHVDFLNFTLEEVQQLEPFLQALGLGRKYLSLLCHKETACRDNGSTNRLLTAEFRERAYDLLRCAVSYRSLRATNNPRLLYDLLLTSSILKTDQISTKHTLRMANGDIIIEVPHGYIYLREQESRLQIFVPQDRGGRELCYLMQLPEALTKLFQVTSSAREIISNVLKSSLFIIDDLLEAAGIGKVLDIQPPLRSSLEEPEEQQILSTEGNSQARSAPLLSVGNRLGMFGSSNFSSLENMERDSSIADTNIRPLSLTSLGSIRANTPNTSASDVRGSPASSIFRDSTPQPPREQAQISHRFPNPGDDDDNLGNFPNNNAYVELLDNVIRIANGTSLPHHGTITGLGDAQFHRGFDREAAFGNRSRNQMVHDVRIGAAGELFVFEMLSNLVGPSFGQSNWQSTIRREVIIHPNYHNMRPWTGSETADITYDDISSTLTTLLIQNGYLEERVWTAARPRYFIEVRTTTGSCNDRFFMNNKQYLMMQNMALTLGHTSRNVYIVFRVFNLGRNNLSVKLYVDPEAHQRRNDLVFESQGWTVAPGASRTVSG